jgi:photosystem II stability/assembly factor-like uncharacterized protein
MKKFIFFIYIFLFFFITNSSLLITNCSSQWLQQDVPVNANTIYDLKFFDSSYGLIATNTGNVYRTTNEGNNWTIQNGLKYLYQMQTIDSVTLYSCGSNVNANGVIYRTFNKGQSWDSVAISGSIYTGLSFVNKDTGWVSAWTSQPVIFRTTNGGLTLVQQTNQFGNGKIFFLKYKINGEYYGWATQSGETWKTTNTGLNWFRINPSYGLPGGQLFFINENTGWQGGAGITLLYITTNGGLNWTSGHLPTNNGIIRNILDFFSIIKSDTIIGSGGSRQIQNSTGLIFRGIIWKSTNQGLNWSFQQPDTAIPYTLYDGIDFIDSVTGWSSNIHTTNAEDLFS